MIEIEKMTKDELNHYLNGYFEPDSMASLSIPELSAIERDRNYPYEARKMAKHYRILSEDRQVSEG